MPILSYFIFHFSDNSIITPMSRIIFGGTAIVLLIFLAPSVNWQALAKTARKYGAKRVTLEGPYLVCAAQNPRIASGLASIAGADNVTVAKQVPRHFSNVLGAITEAGIKAILPDEKFYVKAILAAKVPDYVERDIEFASTGILVEKLAKINALPARNQHEADRVIMTVVGKKWAYVFAK